MLDELYMQDLANAMKMPEEVLPAGTVTVSAPEPEMAGMDKAFVGTRLNVPKPGQPTQQDREKMAVGLLDTLAGALRGAAAQTMGLPGDIRSILDMINQEGAEKYLGQRSFATTEEILKDTSVRVPGTQIDVPFPPVLKEGVPNRAERQGAVEVAQEIGTFLPAPGAPEAAIQGVKAVGKAIKATKNMPVGMSTQMVGQGVDELGFYSAAKQAVDAIQQSKGTGQQFLKQIEKTPGVKPDEIKWTGLDEFLQSKKSVTKAEVQEYLDKNRVEIKEITLSSGANPYPYRTADEWQSAINRAERAKDFDEAEKLTNAWEMFEGVGMSDQTKFSKYTLPGGENYREILLTLPAKMVSEDEARVILNAKPDAKLSAADISFASRKKADEFESQHFDQPNILAHIRVNDRVDKDGKKVLFVEEVQSDWHQAGRKSGYKGSMPLGQAKQKLLNEGYTPEALANTSDADIVKSATEYGVPDAPFKTTWSDLSMKRVIQMASEGGYDRIAFTTGKTQAKRYDLGNEVDELLVTKNDNGTFYIEASLKGGRGIETVGEDISPDKLESFVGKDLATKIRKQESKGDIYDGDDLEVGGEGMKGFYDNILPKFLDKYAKKWDAKTGQMDMFISPRNGAIPVNYIDVTPKMRESVVTKGQPMFAIGAGGAGAAATQEENK